MAKCLVKKLDRDGPPCIRNRPGDSDGLGTMGVQSGWAAAGDLRALSDFPRSSWPSSRPRPRPCPRSQSRSNNTKSYDLDALDFSSSSHSLHPPLPLSLQLRQLRYQSPHPLTTCGCLQSIPSLLHLTAATQISSSHTQSLPLSTPTILTSDPTVASIIMVSITRLTLVALGALATQTTATPAPQLLGGLTNTVVDILELLGFKNLGPVLSAIPVLNSPPPAVLFTQHPSPQCAKVNQGTLLCCQSTLNGDVPLVVTVADAIAYKLNPNSINGIYCSRNTTTCNPGTKLCCQVDGLVDPLQPVISLALYCNQAPTQD